MKRWIDKNYRICFPSAVGTMKDVGYPVLGEHKYDGELNFIIIKDGQVLEMVNKDKYGTHRTEFPALIEAQSLGISGNAILVGELYMPKTEAIQGNLYDFLRNRDNPELCFAVFGIFDYAILNNYYYPTGKVTSLEMRSRLETIFGGERSQLAHIHLAQGKIINNEQELLKEKELAIQAGHEGLMLKALGGIWQDADISYWTKYKKEATADLPIIGFRRNTKNLSLLLGNWKDGQLKAICNCGSGFTTKEWMTLKVTLEGMKLDSSQQFDKENFLVEPKIVVQISYQEVVRVKGVITSLRHPIFQKFRPDKTIQDAKIDIQ